MSKETPLVKKRSISVYVAVVYVLFIVAVLEIWARSYYSISRNANFFAKPGDLVYMWYPELKNSDRYEYDPDKFNVLLMGGSALTSQWGKIPEYISSVGQKAMGKEIRVVNLAAAAHSSLDSFYKYRETLDKRFDMVVIYHAINETRANNVPPELFRSDYSHYAWYEEINWYFKHPTLRKSFFLFPYFTKHLFEQLKREVLFRNNYVPQHSPKKEWLTFGKDVKTRVSFEKNYRNIVEVADRKKEPLILMTFAYSVTRYLNASAGREKSFIDIFGDPDNVVLGIEVHNGIIRSLAGEFNSFFVDQWKYLSQKDDNFSDICHFSDEGSKVFAENIFKYVKDKEPWVVR
ncbi:MAG: hypothetical protein HQL30_08100 [Candidatus Omnitrophica bacterium]|nr:hypothetical protein [Candidatus Omnitrophota bacterium]